MGDPRHTVLRWLVAYNARDVNGALALAHPEIVIRPMRWVPHREYRGLEGVRRWFADLAASPSATTVTATVVRELGGAGVVVEGTVDGDGMPLTGVFEVHGGLVLTVRSYMSDRELLEELGLLGDFAADR